MIEVASLPENDLVLVLEVVADLKRAKAERRAQAAEVVAHARARAAELSSLPREQLFAQLEAALEDIRAEAIALGMAHDGDWVGD